MPICTHSRNQLRWRLNAAGATIIQYQCIDCGASVGSQVSQKDKSPEFLAALEKWDEESIERTRKEHEVQRDISAAAREKARVEWWTWYNTYLRTPQWRDRRLKALERDNYICQGCRTADATQVHHTTYTHVGAELLFELISLCDPCHEAAHKRSDHALTPSDVS